MIVVLTPATETRLTTVEAVARHLQMAPDEAPQSLGALIDVASRMIADYCRRSFGREIVRQIGSSFGSSLGIRLERSPATVSQVVVAGNTVAAEEYYLDAETNVLFRLNQGLPVSWGSSVEITYTAGWLLPGQTGANLPATVEHAAILVVAALWAATQRDPLVKSEQVDGIGRHDFWMPGANSRLPDPTAEALLQDYRRYI